eukprot:Em0005g610a
MMLGLRSCRDGAGVQLLLAISFSVKKTFNNASAILAGLSETTSAARTFLGSPPGTMQVVFEEYVEQLDRSLPWSGIDDDLKTRILQSVESHLQLYKLPMPSKGDLKKRIKAYYASRRNTAIMNMNDEKRRQRRMSLKRNRFAYVARDKAVQKAIQKGELNAGDAEAIKAFRDTVRIDAGAVSPVVSSDDEEAAAQNKKKRLENRARAQVSRQQQVNMLKPFVGRDARYQSDNDSQHPAVQQNSRPDDDLQPDQQVLQPDHQSTTSNSGSTDLTMTTNKRPKTKIRTNMCPKGQIKTIQPLTPSQKYVGTHQGTVPSGSRSLRTIHTFNIDRRE